MAQPTFVAGPYLPADTVALFQQLDAIEKRATATAPPNAHEVFVEAYADRTTGLKTGVRDGTYLFRKEIQGGLEEIFQEIIDANGLPVEPLVLLGRSPVVNASSYGDGIFVINIGLLESLATREELAFVMAHELAHDQLLHLRSRLLKRAAIQAETEALRHNRRAFRRRMRREGVGSIMADLRKVVYEQHRHGRANELSADSLAMHYLRSTKISRSVAARSLENFERKNYFSLDPDEVKRLLNTAEYPFKSSWIKPPATMFGGSFGKVAEPDSTAFWQQDSIATHPDLPQRKARLAELLTEAPIVNTDTTGRVHGYLDPARREIVSSYLDAQMTAHTLVLALKQLAAFGPDDYYFAVTANALLQTHRAIGTHDFDRVVPPSRFFADEGARTVVRMLQQMRASELRKLTTALLAEQTIAFPDSPHLRTIRERAEFYFSSLD